MDLIPEQKPEDKDIHVKRFGYVVSAILLVISNIALVNESAYTPILFILTMYFLTGSLWGPGLIRVFYNLFGKQLFKDESGQPKSDTDHFSKN
jgi:hypothetical protein